MFSNISNFCINQFNPVTYPSIDRRLYVAPTSNAVGDSRYINPTTGDYLFNESGKIAGFFGVQQQVYLSLVTALGSSASVTLGDTIDTIRVIGNNISYDINNAITLALAPLVNAGQITLNGIIIAQPNSSTAVVVDVKWTDLTVNNSQQYAPPYGNSAVSAGVVYYPCVTTRGMGPREIPSVQADWRADRGVVAQFGTVSQWWNELAFEEDGGPAFDQNRNATQTVVADQPTFNGSDPNLNFQPSITFAFGDYLETGPWTDGYLGDPLTIFLVGYVPTVINGIHGGSEFFDGLAGVNKLVGNSNTQIRMKETSIVDAASNTLNTNPNAWIFVFDGANSYYKQSSNIPVSFVGSPGSSVPLGLTIGNGIDYLGLGITIAEMAVFEGLLAEWYQDNLLQYAGNRYGITIT